ncbi:Membrane protein involved in the export of O-antigen and teichoic acid-like [Collimonas arenae]|uniref:Membrane protein involved in the export of O-antigen and teichoic acid-like n=1 Tax=Collimonas arenae TaxID=279058 RepID=A0A0A1FDF4_9BURK|nr:hypothetical protein [Collimonas arenae]AIY41800.1 Membrane protein involved in the export of O-antigen and teichoic acid-like [Collimonas arenae]
MKKFSALFQVIFEQAIFTLSFFCTQTLLARYLSVTGFASFSAVYSAVILLNIIHGCTVMEPLLVFSKSDHFISKSLLMQLHVPLALASIPVTIYLIVHIPNSPPYFVLALVLALTGFIAYWTVRSIAILENKSLKSVIPALSQFAGVCLAIALIPKNSPYQLNEVLIFLGLPLLLASSLISRGMSLKSEQVGNSPLEKTPWLSFGLNNTFSQILVWAMTHGLVIFYMSRQQAELAANFRVVMTLVLPAQYLNIAISNYQLPRLSRLAEERSSKFSAMARTFVLVTLGFSLLYSLLMWAAGESLVGLLFGIKYAGLNMRDYVLFPVIFAAIQGGRTVLKALRLTHYASWAVAVGFLFFLFAFFLNGNRSISNVLIPTVFGLGAAAIIMFYQIKKSLKAIYL